MCTRERIYILFSVSCALINTPLIMCPDKPFVVTSWTDMAAIWKPERVPLDGVASVSLGKSICPKAFHGFPVSNSFHREWSDGFRLSIMGWRFVSETLFFKRPSIIWMGGTSNLMGRMSEVEKMWGKWNMCENPHKSEANINEINK